jgi:hypothetical protein
MTMGAKMHKRGRNQRIVLFLAVAMSTGIFAVSCNQDQENQSATQGEVSMRFHDLKGPYLGQEPPGMTRELFAPGILSDGLFNGMIYFASGGTEVYFSSGFEKPFYMSIFFSSHMEDERWTEPIEFPVKRLTAFRPVLGPDGKRVLFISSKLEEKSEGEPNPIRIYSMDKVHDEWTAPTSIDFGDAFPYSCSQASIASSGNLYFQAGYHIDGDEDIYFSMYEDGKYLPPVRLSDTVNGPEHDLHPFVSPDESYLIFDSQRPGGLGNNDLYVSFPDDEGDWTEAQNLGQCVNTQSDERRASVSYDGKYLFFESKTLDAASRLPEPPMTLKGLRDFWASAENGSKDFYWVDAAVIEGLRPRDSK